ncbi:hypothetical protein D9758_004035 [Tetrapyrgos nigripes]|uniref:Multiple myeloma tumor-associated protein 2-like N-terminal domain-containing protein n=1 Tax=Tetrapyrgos nigripes TaxID=182062 RepID=A0A8H5GLB4_9AGAR|nr:hypothetical protein D9758_004035 [Tetrapyrgos nigripes]
MFEPVRGGTRGGQAEFKWSDVSADKDRENYLGHSINAPTGRWQKNKDVHWYNRDQTDTDLERREEIRKIKEAEADALAVALGFAPEPKKGETSASKGEEGTDPQRAIEKEEKRRRKEEKKARKEEKRAKKEQRRLERSERYAVEDSDYRKDRHRSRSRSPIPRRRETRPVERSGYDSDERERERERDRRRWDTNARR